MAGTKRNSWTNFGKSENTRMTSWRNIPNSLPVTVEIQDGCQDGSSRHFKFFKTLIRYCMKIFALILLVQEIRSVELGVCPMQLFHFWSRVVHPVQNLLLCTIFNRNLMILHWDMAIYRYSKWRPSAILELFSHHTRPPRSHCCWLQLPVKFHVNLIHRSQDIAIWIFRIFGLKCLFRPPKWVLGDFGP